MQFISITVRTAAYKKNFSKGYSGCITKRSRRCSNIRERVCCGGGVIWWFIALIYYCVYLTCLRAVNSGPAAPICHLTQPGIVALLQSDGGLCVMSLEVGNTSGTAMVCGGRGWLWLWGCGCCLEGRGLGGLWAGVQGWRGRGDVCARVVVSTA